MTCPQRSLVCFRRLAAFALVFADMTNALFNPDNGTVLSDAERYLIYFGLLAGECLAIGASTHVPNRFVSPAIQLVPGASSQLGSLASVCWVND